MAEDEDRRASEAEGARQAHLPVGWLEGLARDEGNFRAAADWTIRSGQCEPALRLGAALWRFCYHRGQLSEGRQRLTEALAIASPSSRDREYLAARASALDAAARLAQYQDEHAASRALDEESVAVSQEFGDRQRVAAALQALGMDSYYEGDIASALACLDQSLALARLLGHSRLIATGLTLRGLVAHYQGDLSHARALLEESVTVQWRESQRPDNTSLASLGYVLLDQGDTAGARRIFEELLEFQRAGDFRRGIGLVKCMLGSVALISRDWRVAGESLEEGVHVWQETGERGGGAFVVACCAEWAATVGYQEQARWLAGAAAALRRTHGTPMSHGLQTRLAHTLRRLERLVGPGSLGAQDEAGTVTVEEALSYALATIRQQSPDAAAGAAARRPSRPLGPLTRRELEVAGLVAQGLSNREIAARLVLAERTVATHVEHILGRLDYRSRAQIAAWVGARTAGELGDSVADSSREGD